MTKVLVVSHEASLTGAPRVAVELLRATEGLFDERILVVRWPGPLLDELTDAADRVVLEPFRRARVSLRRFRRTRRFAVPVEEAAARRVLSREKPDLVWLNTVLSACYVRPALEAGCRVVLHSHEMDELASGTLARYRLHDEYRRVQLVACSSAAKDRLREVTGIDEISVVPSVVDSARIRRLAGEQARELNRPQDGLQPDRQVVVACGTADQRKGTDVWLQLARLVGDRMGEASPVFVWVGGDGGGRYRSMTRELDLEGQVRFVGAMPNPYPWVAAADILTVPSRQDAFPLVVFEGMALAKPVVAFDVGGIREQLGDAGVLVGAGDVEAMAAAVVALLEDGEARRDLGRAGRCRLDELFSVERFRQEVMSVVERALSVEPRGVTFGPP